MGAKSLRVEEVCCWERLVELRLPFRFGVITLKQAPQLFMRVQVSTPEGGHREGWAAEMLIPKWFDKRQSLSAEQNIQQLRDSVKNAASQAMASAGALSAWHLHLAVQAGCVALADAGQPALVTHFGPALLQRAVLDALARLHGVGWNQVLGKNLMGIRQGDLPRELQPLDASMWLASRRPSSRIDARHTVGLVDSLDERPSDAPADGLPVSLREVAATWRHRFYKLKLCGDVPADAARLAAIADVLDRVAPGWCCTLDGNEQYRDIEPLVELLGKVGRDPALASVKRALMYVEQPIHRDAAFERPLPELAWPLMIDESDHSLEAFPEAIALGYRGVSSKSCKGLYKAVINRMRCDTPAGLAQGLFISGEDLTMQPGIAVQQDLALASFIGLEHVERNGHFYGDGMALASPQERHTFCVTHPDLYVERGQQVDLRIEGGGLSFASLAATGFAVGCYPEFAHMSPTFSISRS